MAKLQYTPDEDLKVHEEGAIRLICRAFQSHENGLPEWGKNAADAYARGNAPEQKRVIVVILDFGRRDAPASLSCLDFSGMTSDIIESNFRIWMDPEAATRGASSSAVQGGHGNGGKCYMTQMFADYAMLHTVKWDHGNRYGVVGGSIRFGYIPDRVSGRNYPVPDVVTELERVLTPIRCSLGVLPQDALEALAIADGFTLAMGVGPAGYGNRIPAKQLLSNLQDHPQMVRTLELCRVYAIVNGVPFNRGQALALPPIKPMDGAELPRVINIPASLRDPLSEEEVSTTNGDSRPTGTLALYTSDVSMRYRRKPRHVVSYRAQSGYIGYVPVPELDVQSSYRDRIYGECHLESLEPFKQNERARLANSPLTRAVESFVSAQIETYAKEFEARDRRRYGQEEKNAISKLNEALDRWKNRFLDELMRGLWGAGEGPEPPPPPPLPSGRPARMELALTHLRAGLGVSFRPTLRFFDDQGRRIRSVPFRWLSDDNNVAMVDEDLMVVNTFAYGRTTISAETLQDKLRSNEVPLEVVQINSIRIVPRELEVQAGSRRRLDAICRLSSGDETADVYLVWTEDNPSVARVSSSGLVFGFQVGETNVAAGDDRCLSKEPALIKVLPGQGRGQGKRSGRGYPLVLVSGEIDADPETMEYVHFSREDPPVVQRPQDVERNIWWINSAAPLARLYLNAAQDYGYESREWRMYHLERYIDIIVQIVLTHGPAAMESLSVNDWIMKWGFQVAEIQAAAASDLSQLIATGELPTA